ncbi:EamA family transporter [Taibaiella koreensis]|uniref:EamA family transporter n=1 Tax=Taibaiella koreensis TaxID=1268548 RepID=UPI000E5A0A85|nr:DMT family transporter [Taibaiella koreensis]
MKKEFLTGILLVVAGAICFGSLSTVVSLARKEGYDVPSITFAQVLLGFLVLVLLNLLPRPAKGPSNTFSGKDILKVMLHGVCVGLISTFYILSVRYGSAAVSIVLLAQSVWMSIVLEAVPARTFPSLKKIVAAVVILAGTLLATNVLFRSSVSIAPAGMVYGLLAAVANTASIYCSGRIVTGKAPLRRTLYLGMGCLLVVSLVWGPALLRHFDSSILWSWGWALALVGMVLPTLLYIKGMPVIGIGLSAIVTCLQIPVSALLAFIVLGEPVSGYQWLGLLLIAGSIIGMHMPWKIAGR